MNYFDDMGIAAVLLIVLNSWTKLRAGSTLQLVEPTSTLMRTFRVLLPSTSKP